MASGPKVTTISQLKEYAKGQVVELPPFGDGQPFVARLSRPSLLELVKNGSIPNALLNTANSLFLNKAIGEGKEDLLPEVFQVMEALCRATFLEPTYDQIHECGLTLTDEQILFVFGYTQKGIEALNSFRGKSGSSSSSGNVPKVQSPALRANGD